MLFPFVMQKFYCLTLDLFFLDKNKSSVILPLFFLASFPHLFWIRDEGGFILSFFVSLTFIQNFKSYKLTCHFIAVLLWLGFTCTKLQPVAIIFLPRLNDSAEHIGFTSFNRSVKIIETQMLVMENFNF